MHNFSSFVHSKIKTTLGYCRTKPDKASFVMIAHKMEKSVMFSKSKVKCGHACSIVSHTCTVATHIVGERLSIWSVNKICLWRDLFFFSQLYKSKLSSTHFKQKQVSSETCLLCTFNKNKLLQKLASVGFEVKTQHVTTQLFTFYRIPPNVKVSLII